MTSTKLSDLIIKTFHKPYSLIKKNKYLRYVFKGGRGGGKSAFIATVIILLMMKLPISALVVRKVKDTLRGSVFEELKDAIYRLKAEDDWYIPQGESSALYLEYRPRGNKIIFRGADKPEKVKSIKISKFPIMILWIEELAEFLLEDDVKTIEDSVLRAEPPEGLFYLILKSYNPPKRKQSWVNKKYESQFIPDNTLVHHSTYLDNPFISKAFISEAEETKKRDKQKYDHIYGGKPIGNGVVPFNNLVFRKITDEEYNSFDNIRQGIDWGFAQDAVALVRWHYDKTRRTIYAMDEVYGVKLGSRTLARKAKDQGFFNHLTISDVAPRTIHDMKVEHGWPDQYLKPAKKGPDSVVFGEEWLDDLEAIVIDPVRTPNLAREFEEIDYETDRDGNPTSRLEDKNNHTIDATRYAFEPDMATKKKDDGVKKRPKGRRRAP